MKKLFMSFVMIVLAVHMLYGKPVNPNPFVYTQPDGTKLTLHYRGDEYGTWVESSNNDVVLKNSKGYFEYATIVNNEVVSSGVRVKTNANGALAAPSTIASKASISNLISNQRESIMMKWDSLQQFENSQMAMQTNVMRAKAQKTPLSLVPKPKVLCILMGFKDKPFTKSREDFRRIWQEKGYNVDGSQGSVRDFYNENSYGIIEDIDVTVVGPYKSQFNYSYYKRKNEALENTMAPEFVREAINKAIQGGIKLRDFDANGDGEVDAVHVVFAGYETCPDDRSLGIFWSHQGFSLVPQGAYRTGKYLLTPELYGYEGNKIADIGTICHEFGHVLGAPDYYDTNDKNTGGYYPGTGEWDVMGTGLYNWNGKGDKEGNCPAHHNPFTKIYIYGWISPTELITQKRIISPIDKDKLYTLKPINSTKDVYVMPTGTSDEFFLFENKPKLGFNSGCCSINGGRLLIYHIHKDIMDYIPYNTVNVRHPQKCYIVNARATMNPDRTVESYNGDAEGVGTSATWYYPGPSYERNIYFTATSIPSAKSWNGEATGANVCFIHQNGSNIRFVVNPQIDGPDVISNGPETYKIPTAAYAVSAGVKVSSDVKWTYTYIPYSVEEARQTASPIILTNENTWYPKIKRGQYPVYDNVAALRGDNVVRARALDFDSQIVGGGIINRPINATYKYFKGTVILMATITDGKSSYVIAKTIKLEDSTPNKVPALARATSDESEESEPQEQQSHGIYRLIYENPVIANSAYIRVEKQEEGMFVPYEGTYSLTIVGDRTGMTQYPAQTQPYYTIECGNLPAGVYQLILQVDGQVVATDKMLKLY